MAPKSGPKSDQKVVKKKIPIIAQIILSKAIAGEKTWPELIISVSGSNGSKFKLINNINYKGLNKWKIKT